MRETDASISSRTGLPRGVWALGFVSLFMDVSSEMGHGVLPLLLVGTLGASMTQVGLIEGVAESTAAATKLFSGAISDRFGRRKPLTLLGYAMSMLVKPLFPLAGSVAAVWIARFLDRIGKGIRGAPRDALVADITPPEQHGAAFGLRQSLDTVGAFVGPLIAMLVIAASPQALRTVLWIAVVPAVISVATLAIFVHEPDATPRQAKREPIFSTVRLRALPPAFWYIAFVAALFTLMRMSEAFLVLRTQDIGLPLASAPLALVAMNATYVGSAYPAGWLSDRVPREHLLALGCAAMVAADLALAFGHGAIAIFAGILLWGLHMGLTEGVIAALTADYAPADLRGSAFGIVNGVRAVMLLLASVLAGALWSAHGAVATFGVGALVAASTVVAIEIGRRLRPKRA
jgi:MFS family permease